MIKIVLNKNQKIFFTSDTHYSHKNIVRGVSKWSNKSSCRNFDTISEMNDLIVNNINSRVGKHDILIHDGDWSFGGIEEVYRFRRRIVCENIYLFLGNHDDHIAGNINDIQTLFTWVGKDSKIEVITHNGQNDTSDKYMFFVQHFPLASWRDMKKGIIHLFGHLHSNVQDKLMPGKQMDIGIDGNNYFPYSLEEIINIMDKQPIKGLINHDRHA